MYELELIKACNQSDNDQIAHLLEQGASVNARDTDETTALMLCVSFGNEKGAELLLSKGADPTLFNREGWDALRVAYECSDERMTAILVRTLAQREKLIEASSLDSNETIAYKLITTLLYESSRHAWQDALCVQLREYIAMIMPQYKTYTRDNFNFIMNHVETQKNNFFGSYLSDNSDSGDEEKHRTLLADEKLKIKTKNEGLVKRSQVDEIMYKRKVDNFNRGDLKLTGQEGSALFNLSARHEIPRQAPTANMEHDLQRLNEAFRLFKEDPQKFAAAIQDIPTQFVVAQYRGITYLTSRWNQPQRQAHRSKNEVSRPVLSASVHQAMGISPGNLQEAAYEDPEIAQQVDNIVGLTKEILQSFNAKTPCQYKGDAFFTLSDLLHHLYSSDYDGFHHLIKTDPHLKELLTNGANPFISTGDVPYHALKYAFGIKPYEGHRHERLRPRWRNDGRAERPYSGKVYVSLHPVSDYLNTENVYHVISRLWQGKINLTTLIAAERETTFSGAIPKDRVVAQFKAKYPSFTEGYKDIYLEKYGMGPELFEKFRLALKNAPPHTPAHRNFKKLLGEWLCSFYEVKLVDTAKSLAGDRVLVYRDENGYFSFTAPKVASPMQSAVNEELSTPIKQKNSLRRQSASPASPQIVKANFPPELSRYADDEELLDLHIGEDATSGPGLIQHILFQALTHNMNAAFAHFMQGGAIIQHVNKRFNDIYRFKNAHLLHAAVCYKSTQIIALLLNIPGIEANPIADETVHYHWHNDFYLEHLTPFLTAIVENDIELVTFFLQHPLTDRAACAQGVDNKDKLGDLLIPSDADLENDAGPLGIFLLGNEVFSVDRVKNLTPLHLAVMFASPAILQMLLRAGFDPNIENSDGKTAYALAVSLKKEAHLSILRPQTQKPLITALTTMFNQPAAATSDMDDLTEAMRQLFSSPEI